MGLERGPESVYPGSLFLEASSGHRVATDVEGVSGVSAVEGRRFLADARDCTARLPDPERGDRRLDLLAVFDDRVNDVIVELGDVTRTEVVPPAGWERRVEHLLQRQVRHRPATIDDGRA